MQSAGEARANGVAWGPRQAEEGRWMRKTWCYTNTMRCGVGAICRWWMSCSRRISLEGTWRPRLDRTPSSQGCRDGSAHRLPRLQGGGRGSHHRRGEGGDPFHCVGYAPRAIHGLAPTGKATCFAEVGIFRVVNGNIVEKWGMIDRLTRQQQLGATPFGGVRSGYLYSVESRRSLLVSQ